MSTTPKTGIYGTDLTLRPSAIIEQIRDRLVHARGQLSDVQREWPGWKEYITPVEGLLTCGLIALYSAKEKIVVVEIKQDDAELGPSLHFAPRGIGTDRVPSCFVCGEVPKECSFHNIAAFVSSEAEGKEIVQWFGLPDQDCARLDLRPSEPNWIQVKAGACETHRPNLHRLLAATARYGRIRQKDIADARLP